MNIILRTILGTARISNDGHRIWMNYDEIENEKRKVGGKLNKGLRRLKWPTI